MKTKNQPIHHLAPMFCLLIAVVGAGCSSVTGGTKVYPDAVAFIKPGTTTKADIIANFGQPTWEMQRERVISYLWETTGGVNSDWFGRHCEFGNEPTPHAFCIALDESNRVSRSGFTKAGDLPKLKRAILAWSGVAPYMLTSRLADSRPLISSPPLSGPRKIGLAYCGEIPRFDLQIADTKAEVAQDTSQAAFFHMWGGLPVPPSPGEPEWPIVVSTFPFASLPMAIGGVHGAVAGVSAKKIDSSLLILTNAMAELHVSDALNSQLMLLLRQKNPGLAIFTNRFPEESEFPTRSVMDRIAPIPAEMAIAPRQGALCAELRRQGFGEIVAIRVINHGLSGRDGHSSDLSVNMAVRVTLLHAVNGTQGESFYAEYSGGKGKFTDWAANNGQPFRDEFERGLQSIANQIAARLPLIPSAPLELTGGPGVN